MNATAQFSTVAYICFTILVSGCSGTANYIAEPQLKIIGTPKPVRQSINDLFNTIPTPYTIMLCEADVTNKACLKNDDGISASGIGGLGLPLFMDMDGMDISETSMVDAQLTLKAKLNADINKIPPWCGNVEGKVNIKQNRTASMELSNFYCNWAVIGNVLTNVDLSIDTIDPQANSFTGYYKISFYGTGQGVGSGYYKAVIRPQPSTENTKQN